MGVGVATIWKEEAEEGAPTMVEVEGRKEAAAEGPIREEAVGTPCWLVPVSVSPTSPTVAAEAGLVLKRLAATRQARNISG